MTPPCDACSMRTPLCAFELQTKPTWMEWWKLGGVGRVPSADRRRVARARLGPITPLRGLGRRRGRAGDRDPLLRWRLDLGSARTGPAPPRARQGEPLPPPPDRADHAGRGFLPELSVKHIRFRAGWDRRDLIRSLPGSCVCPAKWEHEIPDGCRTYDGVVLRRGWLGRTRSALAELAGRKSH